MPAFSGASSHADKPVSGRELNGGCMLACVPLALLSTAAIQSAPTSVPVDPISPGVPRDFLIPTSGAFELRGSTLSATVLGYAFSSASFTFAGDTRTKTYSVPSFSATLNLPWFTAAPRLSGSLPDGDLFSLSSADSLSFPISGWAVRNVTGRMVLERVDLGSGLPAGGSIGMQTVGAIGGGGIGFPDPNFPSGLTLRLKVVGSVSEGALSQASAVEGATGELILGTSGIQSGRLSVAALEFSPFRMEPKNATHLTATIRENYLLFDSKTVQLKYQGAVFATFDLPSETSRWQPDFSLPDTDAWREIRQALSAAERSLKFSISLW